MIQVSCTFWLSLEQIRELLQTGELETFNMDGDIVKLHINPIDGVSAEQLSHYIKLLR